jgi:RNA recognition motif-containing protein
MNIYVGNLSYSVTEEQLRAAFVKFGNVTRVNLIIDRETGRSKGFGFVEMPEDSSAEAAIKALNGTELDGRSMKISEARPRERRPRF